jgi:peptidoglycan/xylan/chitin deacetylase (PgdA/CDA1 family)
MPGPRLTVALTFDSDAMSDGIRRGDSPVKLSHGEFGPRVGVPRILELLERERIASTWFVPGHTLVTFPSNTEAILAGGHELACHGWYHEDFSQESGAKQADILARSVEAVTRVAGAAPKGFRAPYWALGPDTLDLVIAAGFTYDSSLMADDYRPYRVRLGDRHSLKKGSRFGAESALAEAPISWALDDWPYFEPGPSRDGLSAPSRVLEIWLGELRYAHAHAPGGLLTLTMHPECIGRGHRIAMLEQFIVEARSLDGVVFGRLDAYLDGWAGGASDPIATAPDSMAASQAADAEASDADASDHRSASFSPAGSPSD